MKLVLLALAGLTCLNFADAGKVFKITAVLHKPWLMLKDDSSNRSGNDRYEGYLVDLLDALAKKLHVNYELQLQQDGKYGMKDESGEWQGMIGSVMRGDADLAVGDITITAEREKAVDFSLPFMQTGITILYTQPSWKLQTITSIEDLVNQDRINFGCVRGGATERFFKNSPNPVYNKVWEKMTSSGIMTNGNAEGIERVMESAGDYAYLIESTSADWAISQYCDLVKIGEDINVRNYGIVVPMGSEYRKKLNIAMLELMESGVVSEIKQKWWPKHSKCNQVMSFLQSFSEFF